MYLALFHFEARRTREKFWKLIKFTYFYNTLPGKLLERGCCGGNYFHPRPAGTYMVLYSTSATPCNPPPPAFLTNRIEQMYRMAVPLLDNWHTNSLFRITLLLIISCFAYVPRVSIILYRDGFPRRTFPHRAKPTFAIPLRNISSQPPSITLWKYLALILES